MNFKIKPRIPALCFFALCMLLLGVFKADLLYHMEQFSLFSSKPDFLVKFFEQPGGLLTLCGTFLTQFCHYPLLGALILTAILFLLAYVVRKSVGLEGRTAVLAFIPALFLVLFVTRFDYSIYHQKTYGMVYSQALGFLAAMSIFLLYKKVFAGKKYGCVLTALAASAGYLLFGIYGIFAAVLITISSFQNKENRWANLAATVILGAALPYLCANASGFFPRVNRQFTYFAGTPCLDFVENFICFVPLILTGVALIALLFCKGLKKNAVYIITAVSVLLVIGGSNLDPNFNAVMKMERAVGNRNWDKALKVAARHDNPTRVQVLYRDVALYNKGLLTEQMFTYPDGSAPLKSHAYMPVSMVCGTPVFYYTGMFNNCDQITMELSTAYSKNIHYYKYQTLTAIISGEWDIARKYLNMISGSWFERKWVKRYSAFVDNPESMEKDMEYQMLRPLQNCDAGDYDGETTVEKAMYNHFSVLKPANEFQFEWQMAMLMMQKSVEDFIYLFFEYHESLGNHHITRGNAQALALFGGLLGNGDLMQDIVSTLSAQQLILRQFSQFANGLNAFQDMGGPDAQKWAKEHYPGTYWYYYYFINDLKSN